MATALEQYVNTVRSLSSQGNFTHLYEYLGKTAELLLKNAVHLDNVLATLDLQQHSLGILLVLYIKFTLPNISDYESLYVQFNDFITGCNDGQLCHLFAQSLIKKQQPQRGIGILHKAIKKIQLFDSQLTSVHTDLCQLSLLAQNFKPILEFLDIDIADISRENGHYDVCAFLLYYYYGGMIYAAMKNFDRSCYFFQVCVTTPALAVSHIMLEAYKKYILVSLILNGKVIDLPKYCSNVVNRFFQSLCHPYHDLAIAYVSNDISEVQRIVNKHEEVYRRDNNIGLIHQTLTSLYKKNIQKLTKTFMTLSLSDMASRVQLSTPRQAELYVLHMIEDGDICASINQQDGNVVFQDNLEKFNNSHILKKLDKAIESAMDLEKLLQKMEEEVLLNPQYIQKASGMQDDDPIVSSGHDKVPTFAM